MADHYSGRNWQVSGVIIVYACAPMCLYAHVCACMDAGVFECVLCACVCVCACVCACVCVQLHAVKTLNMYSCIYIQAELGVITFKN